MIAKVTGRNFSILTMTILLALMAGLQQEAVGAAAVWSKEFGKEKPGVVRDGLAVVADPAAAGGQALSVSNTAGAYCVDANSIRLTGMATVAVRLRAVGFVPNSLGDEHSRKQLALSATFRKVKPQKYFAVDLPFQGYQVKADGYVEIAAPVQLEDEPTDYSFSLSAQWGAPNLPKVELFIDRVEIRSGNDGLPYISRVETDKVAYRPGKPIQATVTVYNPGKEKFSGKVICKELVGLDGMTLAGERAVAVEAGQVARVELKWKAALPEAGRELRVELVDPRKQIIHAAQDYYGIAKDPSYLACICDGPAKPGAQSFGAVPWNAGWPATRMQLQAQLEYYKACHLQRTEVWWWSWCDLARFIPPADEEPYLGGAGVDWISCLRKKEQMRLWKENEGGAQVTYIFGSFIGEAGYRVFQEHPEWFIASRYFSFDMEWRAKYERRRELEFKQKRDYWFYGMFNPKSVEARQAIAKELIAVAKETGVEGGRWDAWDPTMVNKGDKDFMGNEIVHTDEEADRLGAECLAEIKKLVAKELPDFTWGYNACSPEEVALKPLSIAEKCRGGGWTLDENPIVYHAKTSPYHYWDTFRDRMIGWGDRIRQMGGIYNPFTFNLNSFANSVDNHYQVVFKLIGGSRSHHFYGIGKWGTMSFRYSDVFFNWNLRLQPESQKLISVTAPATLWWKTMVLTNKSANGRQQTIAHLVNSPIEKEVAENKDGAIRPPVTNVVVSCAAQGGRKPVRAWLVAAEALSAADEDKVQAVPLELSPDADGVKVVVPFVRIWKTVVFEF